MVNKNCNLSQGGIAENVIRLEVERKWLWSVSP